MGKQLRKFGSPSTWTAFGKVMAKAAGQFAMGAVVGIISDVVLAEAQQAVVSSIVKWIKDNLFSGIRGLLRGRLERMAKEAGSPDEFHKKVPRYPEEARECFGNEHSTTCPF